MSSCSPACSAADPSSRSSRSIAALGPTCARGSTPCWRNDSSSPTTPARVEHQVPYTALEAAATGQLGGRRAGGCRARHCRAVDQSQHETAEDTARAEAADIAALVQRVVGPDPWLVSDDDGDRPASYRDITVLIRSRTRLGVLEHTLAPGRRSVPRRGRHVDLRIARGLRAVAGVAGDRRPDEPVEGRHRAAHHRSSGSTIANCWSTASAERRRQAVFRGTSGCSSKEPGVVGDASADARPVRPTQARAHPRRVARRAVRRLAGRCRGAHARATQVARETWRRVRYVIDEARAWSDATGGTLGRIPGLGGPTHRRRRSGRAQHRRGRGLAADHDRARGEGSRVPDHGRCRSRWCRRRRTRPPALRWQDGTPLVRLGQMTSAGWRELTAGERAGRLGPKKHGCCMSRSLVPRTIWSCRCITRPTAAPPADCSPAVTSARGDGAGDHAASRSSRRRHPPDHQRPPAGRRAISPSNPTSSTAPTGQVRRIWTPSGLAKALGDAAGPTSDVALVQGSLFASTTTRPTTTRSCARRTVRRRRRPPPARQRRSRGQRPGQPQRARAQRSSQPARRPVRHCQGQRRARGDAAGRARRSDGRAWRRWSTLPPRQRACSIAGTTSR